MQTDRHSLRNPGRGQLLLKLAVALFMAVAFLSPAVAEESCKQAQAADCSPKPAPKPVPTLIPTPGSCVVRYAHRHRVAPSSGPCCCETAAAPPPREPPFHNTRRRGPLTDEEEHAARTAWKFFENNTQAATGMVNAADKYPSTTMWDTASYIGGLVSAYELKIISKSDFDNRMSLLLKTLNRLAFFRDELPNKAYNTITGEKVDYTNKPGEIGYSALDLGRVLIWLKIVKDRYPIHSDAIDSFVMRWKFCHVVDRKGQLYGAAIVNGQVEYLQEGRLGYEEYSAKGYQLWGFRTELASRPEPYAVIPIYGIDIPYDTRDPRVFGAHNYVVSESYVLDGIELGWDLASDRSNAVHTPSDSTAADFAQRIYRVQRLRYVNTGILTARSEHQLAGDPYFVYDTIFSDGYPWNTITETGKFAPDHSAIAIKAAFGLWALWKDDYTDLLFHSVSDINDPARGFYEGYYENGTGPIATFTSNNNGIILETLLYKVQGRILKFGARASMWDTLLNDEFRSNDKCQPEPLPACSQCRIPRKRTCARTSPSGS